MVFKKYILVTKPLLVIANLISSAGVFFLTSQGHTLNRLFFSLMVGLSFIVASGCVFNNFIDRHIDRDMARTRHRAIATGAIGLSSALIYATVLGLAGALILAVGTNFLALAMALSGLAIYVCVYSMYLKRKSSYSTVIGSLAGAAPPLASYLAVRNHWDLGSFVVLAIFSLWQIPHSYAITIFRYDDYAAAAIPVMPIKSSIPVTKRHIVWHVAAFILASQLLTAFGYAGYSYFCVVTALGLWWMVIALSGYKTGDDHLWAKKMFLFSMVTIFVVSIMMSIDFIKQPSWVAISHL